MNVRAAARASCQPGKPADYGVIHAVMLAACVEGRIFSIGDPCIISVGDETANKVAYFWWKQIGTGDNASGHFQLLCHVKDGKQSFIFHKDDTAAIIAPSCPRPNCERTRGSVRLLYFKLSSQSLSWTGQALECARDTRES